MQAADTTWWTKGVKKKTARTSGKSYMCSTGSKSVKSGGKMRCGGGE